MPWWPYIFSLSPAGSDLSLSPLCASFVSHTGPLATHTFSASQWNYTGHSLYTSLSFLSVPLPFSVPHHFCPLSYHTHVSTHLSHTGGTATPVSLQVMPAPHTLSGALISLSLTFIFPTPRCIFGRASWADLTHYCTFLPHLGSVPAGGPAEWSYTL